jgi:hypothetical protein
MKLLKPSVTSSGPADFFFRIQRQHRYSNATHTTLLLTLMSDVSQEVIDEFFPEVPSVEELQEVAHWIYTTMTWAKMVLWPSLVRFATIQRLCG